MTIHLISSPVAEAQVVSGVRWRVRVIRAASRVYDLAVADYVEAAAVDLVGLDWTQDVDAVRNFLAACPDEVKVERQHLMERVVREWVPA